MTFTFRDYGELRVTLTDEYATNFNDGNEDFRPLGSTASNNSSARGTLLVGMNPNQPPADPTRPALLPPVSFTKLFENTEPLPSIGLITKTMSWNNASSFWRPEPPPGYVALGHVAGNGFDAPRETDQIWCVRQDLVKQATLKPTSLWYYEGIRQTISVWEVVPQSAGVYGDEFIPVFADCFLLSKSLDKPEDETWAIVLHVPKDFKTPGAPPDTGTVQDETLQASVTLPLTAFFPPDDERVHRYIANPFCTINQSIAWYVEGVWSNGTDGPLTRTKQIKYGMTESQSETIEHTIGVSVSAEGGIGLVESKVTLNYQFSDKKTSSFSELVESTTTVQFSVELHSITIMYCKVIRLSATLPDGTIINQADSLVTDEYFLCGAKLPVVPGSGTTAPPGTVAPPGTAAPQ
ncbi:hypothetical protein PT974_01558 [Cladobotryum mycophilum]|uniref:Insecticidal crystal toxin domain-containing protein n=1 Tax=Cladobotryum mycophilum TaxID=491253 RepID=A0ABR0T3Y6_9HYPO